MDAILYGKAVEIQESPKGDYGLGCQGQFSLEEGVAACTLSGHHITLSLTIARHSISCESRTVNSFAHCTLLGFFRNKKNEYHF